MGMDTGSYCPARSLVRETCDCVIGEAPTSAFPLERFSTVRDSLRRCGYAVIVQAVMSTRKCSARSAEMYRLSMNSADIDVCAASHFVAYPADRSAAGPPEPPRPHPGNERRQLPAQAQQGNRRVPSSGRSRGRIGCTVNAVSSCSFNVSTPTDLLQPVITSAVHDYSAPISRRH